MECVKLHKNIMQKSFNFSIGIGCGCGGLPVGRERRMLCGVSDHNSPARPKGGGPVYYYQEDCGAHKHCIFALRFVGICSILGFRKTWIRFTNKERRKMFSAQPSTVGGLPSLVIPRNESRKGGGTMKFTYSDLIQTIELFVAVVALIIQSKRK